MKRVKSFSVTFSVRLATQPNKTQRRKKKENSNRMPQPPSPSSTSKPSSARVRYTQIHRVGRSSFSSDTAGQLCSPRNPVSFKASAPRQGKGRAIRSSPILRARYRSLQEGQWSAASRRGRNSPAQGSQGKGSRAARSFPIREAATSTSAAREVMRDDGAGVGITGRAEGFERDRIVWSLRRIGRTERTSRV